MDLRRFNLARHGPVSKHSGFPNRLARLAVHLYKHGTVSISLLIMLMVLLYTGMRKLLHNWPLPEPTGDSLERPRYERALGLGEIRLLVLRPGQCRDRLSCHLEYKRLDDNPKYEALYYVWAQTTHTLYSVMGRLFK
jgi:hypothetical protein